MPNFLTPVGRMVGGNLYRGDMTDSKGHPLVFKSGQNVGQPRTEYSFAVAIPKTGAPWNQSEWGRVIAEEGRRAFPVQSQSSRFSWKVQDGDSTEPNSRGKRNCDREGAPGHWLLWLSGSLKPRVARFEGQRWVTDTTENLACPGDYIQVAASVVGNDSTETPGVYLNYEFVGFVGYCTKGRIDLGADPDSVGFGAGALPADLSSVPVGAAPPPAAAPLAAAAPPAPVAVAPNTAFLDPQPPPPPAAPPARAMTDKATATYDAYIKSGWTDAQLIQHGYMLA